MKRFFCLLLVLCFLPVLSVSAVDNYRLELNAPTEVYSGEEIALTFSFTSIPAEGLCGMDFEMGFNGNLVEFAGVDLAGFPQEGNWCASGRTVGSTFFLYVFDNYNEAAGAPCSVYSGSNATVTLRFKAKKGVKGTALFSIGSFGNVTGTSFAEDGPVSVYGVGATNKSVNILPAIVEDGRGDNWYTKDGVMYIFPGADAEDLASAGVLTDKNGVPKSDGVFAVMGDGFEFNDGTVAAEVRIAMDVNGDGYFSTADYLLLRRHLCAQTTLTGKAFAAADINGDRTLSTSDLAALRTALLGATSI